MTRREAKEIAKEYSNFLHFHPNPSEEEWKVYKKIHPKVLDSVYEQGPEALMEMKTPEEHPEHDEKEHEHPQSRVLQQLQDITQGSLGLFRKSQSLEEDSAYLKVEEQLKRNYLKNRNKKRFDLEDKQDLDFLYGSVDDPQKESVETAAEKVFRAEAAKDPKKQKDLQRYDKNKSKIHDNFEKDPYVYQTKVKIAEHGALRHAALKKEYKKAGKKIDEKFNQDFKHTMERLKENRWKKFVDENPQKAAVYVAQSAKQTAGKPSPDKHTEEDDFVYLQKTYEKYRAQASQGQARPTSTVLQQPFSGPSLHTESVSQSLQSSPTTTVSPPSPKVSEEQKFQSQPLPRPQSPPIRSEGGQAPQPPTPRLSQNIPSTYQQGLTPQSKPSHPSIPKPPSQGFTRPPQYTPLPITRRYIPSQGRTRPGGYSNPMVSLGRNFIQDRLSGMGKRLMGRVGSKVGQAAGNAGKQLAQKAAARLLMNPYVLIVIGVILLIILIIIIIVMIIMGAQDTSTKQPTTIPGLTLSLVGPTQVQNSENIQYTINATYTGIAEITLSDPLPTTTTFVSATGNFTNTNNTIAWKLNDPDLAGNVSSPAAGTAKSYSFTLILHPEKEDVLVKNKIIANAVGGSSGGNIPIDKNATDFDTLMTGQGRNINILGDENNFVNQTIQKDRRLSGQEDTVRTLYRAAVARNVNPLVILTLYGEEAGFASNNDTQFGCRPFGSGFAAQLSCSVATWDNWMKYFDEHKDTNGTLSLGGSCVYTDPFIFAAEKYGPRCVINENQYFTKNFVLIFKQLLN